MAAAAPRCSSAGFWITLVTGFRTSLDLGFIQSLFHGS